MVRGVYEACFLILSEFYCKILLRNRRQIRVGTQIYLIHLWVGIYASFECYSLGFEFTCVIKTFAFMNPLCCDSSCAATLPQIMYCFWLSEFVGDYKLLTLKGSLLGLKNILVLVTFNCYTKFSWKWAD